MCCSVESVLMCDLAWLGMTWYDMTWCDVIWCGSRLQYRLLELHRDRVISPVTAKWPASQQTSPSLVLLHSDSASQSTAALHNNESSILGRPMTLSEGFWVLSVRCMSAHHVSVRWVWSSYQLIMRVFAGAIETGQPTLASMICSVFQLWQ